MQRPWFGRRSRFLEGRAARANALGFFRPKLERLEDRLVPSSLSLDSAFYDITPANGQLLVTVNRTGTASGVETVNYSTADGTARAGVRYVATSGTLTFQTSDTSQTITIPMMASGPLTVTQTFHVQLSNPTGGASIGSPGSALVNIRDSSGFTGLGTLAVGGAVWPGGFSTTCLQYAPNGNLAMLLWIKNSQGEWDLNYVERTNFGDFRTEPLPINPVGGFFYFPGNEFYERSTSVPAAADLLFDSSGNAHVVVAQTFGGFQHFLRNATGWSLVDQAADFTGNMSLAVLNMAAAIAPDNTIHVVIDGQIIVTNSTTAPPRQLLYGTNKSGQWVFASVVNLGNVYQGGTDENPRYLSIAAGANDAAYIAYTPSFQEIPVSGTPYSTSYSQLAFATNRSGSWATQVVYQPPDTSGDAGEGASIAVAPNGTVAIASYYVKRVTTGSAAFSQLLYHTLTAAGWTNEVVAGSADGFVGTDGSQFTGYNPELKFDAAGNPHIAFSDHASSHYADSPGSLTYDHEFNGQIRYAVKTNGQWSLATILRQTDPKSQEITFPDFALSPGGAVTFSGLNSDPNMTSPVFTLLEGDGVPRTRQHALSTTSALTMSAEDFGNLVAGSYLRYLKRSPSSSELAYWIGQLQKGTADEAFAAAILSSTEYLGNHGGAGSTWIQALFSDVLGRSAGTYDITYWTGQLHAGVQPFTVAIDITTSQEHETQLVTADYVNFLDRVPDSAGLAGWLGQVAKGTRQETIQADILASHEYFFGHGQGNIPEFVQALYQDVLRRPASASDTNYWVGFLGGTPLSSGLPARLAQTATLLTESDEAYTNFINNAYQKYLGRAPDAGGLAYWLNLMRGGLTDEHLEASFLGSAEYIANHGGAGAGWVKGMYLDLLGRTPSQAEINYWVNILAGGTSTTDVAFGFASSNEREGQRVTADYKTYLARTPTSAEVSYWVSAFAGGLRNEAVQAGFLSSKEYFTGPKGKSDITAWLVSAYEDALSRNPTADECTRWINWLT
jgi:hypothetical protein